MNSFVSSQSLAVKGIPCNFPNELPLARHVSANFALIKADSSSY
jgi:hypothetical protein